MRVRISLAAAVLCVAVIISALSWKPVNRTSKAPAPALLNGRYLFAAVPGVRDYLGYGGHGLVVFDIDHGHKFVKRIPLKGLHPKNGLPSNVKGIGVSIPLHSVYITTL